MREHTQREREHTPIKGAIKFNNIEHTNKRSPIMEQQTNSINKPAFIQADIVHTFPYILKEDSSVDNLHKGDIVTVDTEMQAKPNSIVLLKLKESEALQIKRVKNISAKSITLSDDKDNFDLLEKSLVLFAFPVVRSERAL